jgi:chaperonin GroES
MDLIPIGERAIVQRDATLDRSEGGIILPDKSKQAAVEGTVIAVGPDCTILKEGVRVLFARYSGADISDRGSLKNLMVMNEGDAVAIIQEA